MLRLISRKQAIRGVGFPTSVSPNHLAGNVSPLKGDESILLNEGDIVKVQSGLFGVDVLWALLTTRSDYIGSSDRWVRC